MRSNPALIIDSAPGVAFATDSSETAPPALRVEFGLRRDRRAASSEMITIALLEPASALAPVAEPIDSPDFVCDSAIAAACFILSRALRLPSSVLTTNPRLFNVICAAVALAHSPAGILVEGEIGVGKESMIKLIHGASGDPQSLLYAECAGLEATAVAAEISPLLAPDAGSDYHDAKLSHDPHHLDDPHLDDRSDDAYNRDAPRTAGTSTDNLGHLAIPLGRTIFFNHLGELSLAAQRNLLDLLRTAAPRIRLLAASVQPLASMVARGEFRADLHQLFDATLTIIPLRDRPGDLPMLARHVLRMRNPAVTLDAAAIRTLERYPFPGNLRELTNFVTRLAIVPAQPRHLSGSPLKT
jgi:transcriptional regulator of acetoin/glycerol metabolism